MSTKKGKKNRGTTVSLQAFNAQLEDGKAPSAGQNVVYASKKATYTTNWADEMDEEELITEKERILLPSGPRSSRGPNIDDNQIPRSPPFTAHLSNVAYELGEEDMYNFFQDLKIESVRIPRDPGNRPKGYAYVDFENREDLITALSMSDQNWKGRSVRISLGEGQNRRDGGPGRSGGGGNYSDATPSDWRSDMRPNSPPRREGGGGFNDFRRGNDFDRGAGFERGREPRDRGFGGGFGGGSGEMTRDQMTGGRRGGFNDFPSERGDRDNFQRDRSGSNEMDSSWRNQRAPQREEEPEHYRNSYGGGGGPSFDYGGMRSRDSQPRGQDRRERNYDQGSQRPPSPYRGGGGGGGHYEEDRGRRTYNNSGSRASRENSPPMYRNTAPPPQPTEQPGEPQRERKKLVLAPRTVKTQIAEPAPETSSAIFGGAKPVDTAAREKEIEEKLLSMEIRTTANRVRSDSQVDEPRVRILQRTPEERDRRDRELKFERERRQRERFPSISEKAKEFQLRQSIPEEPLPKGLQQRRSPATIPSVASSYCSENFHPNSNPPASKHIQRSEADDDCETEGSTKPQVGRNESVQNETTEPLKNPWTRRKELNNEDVPRRPIYESERKTPDFDRNSEKEKDTNSDPEDDRDTHHRFINEDNVAKDDDDDDDFHKVSRSRGKRDRGEVDKGYARDDGSRGDRRGGSRGGAYPSTGGGGGYAGSRPGPVDSSGYRRGGDTRDRGDAGPRRPPYEGRGSGGPRYAGYASSGGPPTRDR